MWIKFNDKIIINLNNIVSINVSTLDLTILEKQSKHYILITTSNNKLYEYYYSSHERCVKVFDEMQSWITKYKTDMYTMPKE